MYGLDLQNEAFSASVLEQRCVFFLSRRASDC